MPRLIDADALENRAYEIYVHASPEFKTRMNTLKALIDEAPTIDAEPIVRCKECKHFRFGDYCMHDGAMEHSHARENDFCSYGERRESNGQNPTD